MVSARPAVRYGLPILIAVVSALPFLPAVTGEFLNWDDDAQFLGNPHYRGFGPQNLKWMFTDNYGHYMPLTWITHGIDYLLWGMNPVGYHAVNTALHALNAVLFFFLLRRLLRRVRPEADPDLLAGAAAVGALFFSIHPLRVESVAWITERRDVLSCAFFLGTLLAYVRMTEEPAGTRSRLKWLGVSSLCFAAMLLCKTMGLTLPLVLFVLDVYPLRRFSRASIAGLLREKLPYLALMAGSIIMVQMSVSKADAFYTRDQYPLIQSIAQPGYKLCFYIGKILAPVNLSPLYFFRPDLGAKHVLGWVGLLGLASVLLLQRHRLPAGLAAFVCFGILIAPTSGLVQVGPQLAADRYTYIPGLPFAAIAGTCAILLADRLSRRIAFGACAVLLLGLGVLTFRQSAVWKDSVSLWSRAIDLEPDVYFTRDRRGQAFAARREWDRALADYDLSIQLNGGWFESWAHRAQARLMAGNPAGAIEDATRSLQLHPDSADALITRGTALGHLGRSRDAVGDLSRALTLRPGSAPALVSRAGERAKLGDLPGARTDLDRAIDLDPQPHIYFRRSAIRALQNDLLGTVADCTEAVRLKPDFADAWLRRGIARLELGQPEGAAQDAEQALRNDPASWPARAQAEDLLRRARAPK